MRHPLLLLPRPLDQFVLGDHARQLLEAGDGAVALPGVLPYGALVRAPAALRGGVARSIAGTLRRAIPDAWFPEEVVLVAYHAIQWPAAKALLDTGIAADLWYCRWDRYEAAHDAGRPHRLLGEWHREMAERSSLTFAVSGKLAAIEHEAGREAIVVGLCADGFPDEPLVPGGRGADLVRAAIDGSHIPESVGVKEAQAVPAGGAPASELVTSGAAVGDDGVAIELDLPPAPRAAAELVPPIDGLPAAATGDAGTASPGIPPIAVSLGHLGRRTDWRLLRAIIARMADLQLLLIGAWHDDEVGSDPDYRWLRASPQVVWLGALDDADAAAVIAEADVGLVPFTVDPFNDAGLPTRILKYARLGRPTLSPDLAGARTWSRATTFPVAPTDFVSQLRAHAGQRLTPDLDLRAWALEQTAEKMNAPLLERLAAG